MKRLINTVLICFVALAVNAQSNFSQYQLNNTAQSQYLNPAFRSSSKIGISIAPISNVFNLQVLHTGFALDDALSTRPNSDSLDLTPSMLIERLNDANYLDFNLRNEMFGLVITTKKSTFSLTVNSVINTSFSYPKDLLGLAFYGNGGTEYLGQRVALDNLGANALAYLETGFGFNRKIGDKLVVGGKVKYLIGVGNIQTEYMRAGITTDTKTYDIEIDGAARVNTSNLAGLNNIINNLNNPFEGLKNIAGSENNGFGLDIGATYQLGNKIRLSASLIDIGTITWRDSVTNYQIDEFEFKYEGVDLLSYLVDTNAVFDAIVDSLENLTDVKETNSEYKTSLYTKAYLGGNFEITKFFNVGLVWFSAFSPSRYITAVNVSANIKLKHKLGITANYGIYNYRDSNFGLGFSLRSGPIQFFVMSDNAYAVLKPESTKNIHLSFGLSLQIGKSFEYGSKDKSLTVF